MKTKTKIEKEKFAEIEKEKIIPSEKEKVILRKEELAELKAEPEKPEISKEEIEKIKKKQGELPPQIKLELEEPIIKNQVPEEELFKKASFLLRKGYKGAPNWHRFQQDVNDLMGGLLK